MLPQPPPPPSMIHRPAEPPAMDLRALAWLQGEWRGETGPERLDEHWCLEGRSLMGFSRTLAGEASTGFEVMVLEPGPEGWVLRIRLFGPSLETAGRGGSPLRLKLVEADQAHLLLEGLGPEAGTRLSYRLDAPGRLTVELTKPREGKPWTRTFKLVKAR